MCVMACHATGMVMVMLPACACTLHCTRHCIRSCGGASACMGAHLGRERVGWGGERLVHGLGMWAFPILDKLNHCWISNEVLLLYGSW